MKVRCLIVYIILQKQTFFFGYVAMLHSNKPDYHNFHVVFLTLSSITNF